MKFDSRTIARVGPTRIILLAGVVHSTAQAQHVGAWTGSFSAGSTLPTSTSAVSLQSGLSLGALMAQRRERSPLSFRLETAIDRMNFLRRADRVQVIRLGTSATWDVQQTSGGTAYVIGGAAGYRVQVGQHAPATTDLGLDGGVGWRRAVSGSEVFIEGRYRSVSRVDGPFRYIPISAGITF